MESFDFGIRTLVQQGGSYTVSLPASWVKMLEDKGGVRIVMESDFTLRVLPIMKGFIGISVWVVLSSPIIQNIASAY